MSEPVRRELFCQVGSLDGGSLHRKVVDLFLQACASHREG